MSVWSADPDPEGARERRLRRQQEEQEQLEWEHYLYSPDGIEDQYQAWCRTHHLDPEDVGSMTAYEGL